MNEKVNAYINNAPAEQKAILTHLRTLLHQVIPHLNEAYKWSRPVFGTTKDVVYFKATPHYVTLGFFNPQDLKDPDKRLQGTGKNMRHIKLKTVADIDDALLKNGLPHGPKGIGNHFYRSPFGLNLPPL